MRDAEVNSRSVRVAISCSIGIMLASGTAIIGTFGIFMLPILREFHWGRAQISGVVMTMSCTTALMAPVLGKLQDCWGVRKILLPGIVLYAASVMLLSTARGAIAQFYLLYFLVGIAATLISIVPYTKVISQWFHRTRGIVLALVGAGVSVGASLLPQVARIFIGQYGWRGAYVGIGLLIVGVNLPVQILFLKESPPKSAASPNEFRSEETSPEVRGMTAPEIRRSGIYWTLIGSIFLTTFVVGGVLAHLVPMMVDRGIRSAEATNALTLYILGGIAGRLTMGRLLDRFSSPRVVFPFYLIAIAGLFILYTARDPRVLALSGALIGVCSGAEGEFGPYLHSRYFGLRAFAETYGLQFMFLAVANGLGPVAMGAVYDLSGSYWRMIFVHITLLAVAAGLLLSLSPYARVAHDQKTTQVRRKNHADRFFGVRFGRVARVRIGQENQGA